MKHIEIMGGKRLRGEVVISGSKNAAVAIIPAALCTGGVCIIENLPNIKDVVNYVDALTELGAKCEFLDSHTLKVDSSDARSTAATFDSLRDLRASYYLVGVLLGRFKRAEVMLPGGDNFGTRPIDQHIKGFEALGAKIVIEHGVIKATADRLVGTNIYLDMASVGATINIMLVAIHAEGTTIIENAAKEPHIVDTANFLNTLGANIKGAGTDIIRINGGLNMHGGEYTIIPDQIETGTYMIAAAITGGDVTVSNIIPKHMDSLTAKLLEMNCKIEEGDDLIRVIAEEPLHSINIKAIYYPGFPTDLQPQMSSLLSTVSGTSIVTESVFDNRFQYVNELRRLGAKITVDGRVAFIEGPAALSGAEVTATDIRGGASLVVAALAASGKTVIGNIKYIDRGYENIVEKLKRLGAQIERVDTDAE